MMRAGHRTFALIALAVVLSGTAAAQSERAHNWQRCTNAGDVHPPSVVIAGCTEVIRGRETPQNKSVALRNRAIAYRQLGDPRALEDATRIVSLEQVNRWYRIGQRGSMHLYFGDRTAAERDYQRAVDLAPEEDTDKTNRASMFAAAGNYEAAMSGFAAALAEEEPDDRDTVLYCRCWARVYLNRDLDLARNDCDEALRLEESGLTYYTRGILGLRQGRYQDAWNDLDAAVRFDPSDGYRRYARGFAAAGLGRANEAAEDWMAGAAREATAARYFAALGITP